MLEVTDLYVNYGKVEAVRGVSLSVRSGQVTLVLGANAAGKTTTLRTICGLHPSVSGSVALDGEDITRHPVHRIVRRGLVLVPEGRRIFPSLSVRDNLRLGGFTAPRTTKERMAEVFEMFPILRERAHGAAGLLSGGEQQMLAFGRALMSGPRVILMDEPSMGLAPAVIDIVMESVRKIADAGLAVLMVEQNAVAGLEVADEVMVMAAGESIYTGPAGDETSASAIVRGFLGDVAATPSASAAAP